MGGGGGGANSHQGGGGSGFVVSGTFNVTPGMEFFVTVGSGGSGALKTYCIQPNCYNYISGNSAGGTSSFGYLINAGGGQTPAMKQGESSNELGANGGSGGGAGGYSTNNAQGGNGGSDGSNAGDCGSRTGGVGQGNGSFTQSLKIFTRNQIRAGKGGKGSNFCWLSNYYAGGGGGGILINGLGPLGGDGKSGSSGAGGEGFGAGGGGGGLNPFDEVNRHAGGEGAPGLVYVEWD